MGRKDYPRKQKKNLFFIEKVLKVRIKRLTFNNLKKGRAGLMVFAQTIPICICKFFLNNSVTRYRLETIYNIYYHYYYYIILKLSHEILSHELLSHEILSREKLSRDLDSKKVSQCSD